MNEINLLCFNTVKRSKFRVKEQTPNLRMLTTRKFSHFPLQNLKSNSVLSKLKTHNLSNSRNKMHLFLTSVLPLLAHDHASAAAFLTCRHHNFHASIIPEFLSHDERVKKFTETRQQNQLAADKETQYKKLFSLFVQTPLMQFSPSLALRRADRAELILKSLLKMKYFTRTLQRCVIQSALSDVFLRGVSKVQSLTKLDLSESLVESEHLAIIVNSFSSLETLNIENADLLDPTTAFSISSPPPPATKTLRNLTMRSVDSSLAIKFVPHFNNLRKLDLRAKNKSQELNLRPLSSSLPLLTDLSLMHFSVENIESLKNLVHLSIVQFYSCKRLKLSFLVEEANSLPPPPQLLELCIDDCQGLATSSFAFLAHTPDVRALKLRYLDDFNNDGLQHLEKMVHLRKLSFNCRSIAGASQQWLKTLMQNLFQLEELDLMFCNIGNQGAIAGALYSTDSRLRTLNLCYCSLVNDDLKGIGALKTLENLELSRNRELTNEALVHCGDLVKLKWLRLYACVGINDLSPLKGCLNLEDLDVDSCYSLTDGSFRAFGEEPNSFPNLRVLNLAGCKKLTEIVFEHLQSNNYLVYQLKKLNLERTSVNILSSSRTARNNICQLKGLSRLNGIVSDDISGASNAEKEVMKELVRRLKNLEEIS